MSSVRFGRLVASMACLSMLAVGCTDGEIAVISKDYGLCAEVPKGAEVSFSVNEDHEGTFVRQGASVIKIGISSRPTAPAMLIAQYHPVIRNGEKVSDEVATRLVDIYQQDKVQALAVIGTDVVGRILYVEAFSDSSNSAAASKIIGTVRKCQR